MVSGLPLTTPDHPCVVYTGAVSNRVAAPLIFVLALSLGSLSSACGDDGDPADGGLDASADARDTAPPDTGPPPVCTAVPTVVDTGLTADTDPGIDPATYETDATTIAFDPEAVPASEASFPHGIMAGAMKPDSALFWTHRVGTGDTILRVYRQGAAAGEVVVAYEATVAPDAFGYVRETAAPLAPATVYNYAFFVSDGADGFTTRSGIGRVRTALAPDMALKLTFGATTCTGSVTGFGEPDGERQVLANGGYPALTLLADMEVDALLHLGDMSYNDAAWVVADMRPPADAPALYRSNDLGWGFTQNIQGYRDVLASTGLYFTLDDHEVVDSDAFDPETMVPSRLTAALDTMVQNVPIERGPGGELWASYQWGLTAEVIVTDLRTERLPSTRTTDDAIFVGAEQLAFIKDRLLNSTAHFKLVFSSVNMTNLPGESGWDIPLAFNDRWEGYDSQRRELLDFIIDNGIDDIYFLAGDIHANFVGRLEPEGTSPYARMWEITVGPGASGDNPLGALLEQGILMPQDVFPCEQFVFGSGRTQVATTLELDPLADTLRVRFIDALTEEVLYDDVLQQEP
ncbi:MAG: hypothetical protein DRJ42_04375 [Deltaproteobacteria bacterium]|nr:MAG: hypothetical protein DRJ42_04375 [Deltaproteobacteria bacterium]